MGADSSWQYSKKAVVNQSHSYAGGKILSERMLMQQETLKENSILVDRSEFLYIEHAIIEQQNSSICVIQSQTRTPIPVASLACLILGPGTTITHRAVEAMADSGCLLVWSGEKMRTWYASGMDENRKSANFLKQAKAWVNTVEHMRVVRWMYKQRFPDMDMRGMSLEAMRGAEGLRMQETYKRFAEEYGVEWNGRAYDRSDFSSQDSIQQMITVGNKLLYNVCHAGILSLGFSPTLGFIHTGTMRSFVYDLADLYKTDIVIPTAFECTSSGLDFAVMRKMTREAMQDNRLLKRIEKDLLAMFSLKADEEPEADSGSLWGAKGDVVGGKNYGKK